MTPRTACSALLVVLLVTVGTTGAGAEWQQFQAARDGLAGSRVSSILEDDEGYLWFGTRSGASRYDGRTWLTVRDPLPSLDVTALAQDHEGNLWFGTANGGVFRFDGARWTRFDAGGETLPSNQINEILVDHEGDLWLGTPAGLVRHVPASGSWSVYASGTDPLVHPNVLAMDEDTQGYLWIGTPAGANRLDPSRALWTTYLQDPGGLGRDSVLAVGADPAGGVWMGTDQGLYRFLDDAWSHFDRHNSGLLSDTVTVIARDAAGGMWFGGFRGLSWFNGTNWRRWTQTDIGTPLNQILSLREDSSGNLWVGTGVTAAEGGALYRFDRTAWNRNLPFSNLNDILVDHGGENWVATSYQGVHRLDRQGRWDRPRPLELPAATNVILEDVAGALWFGSLDGGIVELSPDRTSTRSHLPNAIGGENVQSLYQDSAGRIWAGTSTGGAFLENGVWTRFLDGADELGAHDVQGFLEDGAGAVWIRSTAGLHVFDPQTGDLTPILPGEGLQSNLVNDFLVTTDGDLWLATRDGLSRLRGSTWTTIPSLVNSFDTMINVLMEDRTGALWVGSGAGASRHRAGTWDHYGFDVLRSVTIIGLFEDEQGTIWISAKDKGVVRFNGQDWRAYRTADGLASLVVTRMLQDSRGAIWFGSYGGVVEHDPDRVAPQSVFISLPPSLSTTRLASFSFGAGYAESSFLEFRSLLDGMPWQAWGSAVSTELTGLSDGTHAFSVTVRDWVGNEDPTPATYIFEVDATPPSSVITDPTYDEALHEVATISGIAEDPRFAGYAVIASPLPRGGTPAGSEVQVVSSSIPVPMGALGSWDTRDVPDGWYRIVLSVSDTLGVVGRDEVDVQVDNYPPSAQVTSPAPVSATGGGHVHTADDAAHLYFPPGAFANDVVVELDPEADPPSPLPAGDAAGAYRVAWGTETLRKSAVLDLRVGDSPPVGKSYAVYGQSGAGWARIGGSLAEGSISVPASASGTYLLVVEADSAAVPPVAAALTPVPNPAVFSPTGGYAARETAISFVLPHPGRARVAVYNRAGRLVKVIGDDTFSTGAHVLHWNGRTSGGDIVPDGLYLVSVEFEGESRKASLAVVR